MYLEVLEDVRVVQVDDERGVARAQRREKVERGTLHNHDVVPLSFARNGRPDRLNKLKTLVARGERRRGGEADLVLVRKEARKLPSPDSRSRHAGAHDVGADDKDPAHEAASGAPSAHD
jgi:hypothetical protein